MRRLALLAFLAVAALVAGRAALANRLALWDIVHGQCVPAAAKGEPLPKPCLEVEPRSAVIKDSNGVAQLLAIPTERITGIEDPAVLAPDAPNIFASAWGERTLMRKYLPTAPEGVGLALAVNSAQERSQDQLHVHVDCLKPDVAKALADFTPEAAWTPMSVSLAGHTYFARAVPDLAANPFRLLAEIPGVAAEMGEWTLAAVPQGKRFVLLAGRHGGTGGGHAEDIQDSTCAIAR
jgi:CDP-diacylglycerol pyrophosphatase